MLGTMPGSRPTNPMKFRLTVGSSMSSRLVMLPPTSLEVTSTSGDSPVTVTCSSTPPTSSRTSTDVVSPTDTRMSRCVYFLKPGSPADISYGPGRMPLMKNVPSALLSVSRKLPVSWLRTTTTTPGRTARCWSTTRPRISAVPCCARTGARKNPNSRIIGSPPWCRDRARRDSPVGRRASCRP